MVLTEFGILDSSTAEYLPGDTVGPGICKTDSLRRQVFRVSILGGAG